MVGAMKGFWAGIAMMGAAMPASAKVVQAGSDGFVVSQSAEVQARPEAVWAALTHPERWWNKAHSWTGNARNFSMTLKPGGCFCEALPDSGFAEHSRIVFFQPNRLLRLSGAFGPLQGEALAGTLTVKIDPGKEGASVVAFEYVVGGYSRMPLTELAPAVDGVIAEQHRRLLKLIASGSPD
jgi:uncharacterized protein YndB with AHSA1/START domain